MATTVDPRSYHNGATRRRRSLEIPPPPGQREIVVVEALKTLAKRRKKFVGKVEDAIENHGITIEVARLRDRLTKLALGDTERLLLSTPGVTGKLFYKVIEEELEDDDADSFKDFLAEMFRNRGGKDSPDSTSTRSTSAGGATSAKATGRAGATGAGKTAQAKSSGSARKAPPTPATDEPVTEEGAPK
jgi:hypothetical protein